MLRLTIASSAALAVIFFVVGFALPTSWEASRTMTFEDAAPDQVGHAVGDLASWPEWSVWSAEQDERIEVEVTGSGLTWKSDELGEGVLTVTSSGAESVTYGLASDDLQSSGEISWSAVSGDGGGTSITWRESGEVTGGPLVRWFALLSADATVGGRIEGALERLEERL